MCALWSGHGAAAGYCLGVPLQSSAAGCCCQSGMCEQACAAARCCLRALLFVLERACWCVQGAAAGAAARRCRVMCAFWSGHAGAAAGCC